MALDFAGFVAQPAVIVGIALWPQAAAPFGGIWSFFFEPFAAESLE